MSEIMKRREMLREVWMDRFVKPSKVLGIPAEDMWTVGVILDRNETLRMPVYVGGVRRALIELVCETVEQGVVVHSSEKGVVSVDEGVKLVEWALAG